MLPFLYMWWFWLAMALIVVLPVSYGWGYRGWGAPYPRYVQRRRMQYSTSSGAPAAFNHQAWGGFGDIVWMLILCDIVFFTFMFWPR